MKVLVTGSKGFIGKNLCLRLEEKPEFEIITFDRQDLDSDLKTKLHEADVIIHLAGENRPLKDEDFNKVNFELTQEICSIIKEYGQKKPIIMASSAQANKDNPYGKSKLAAENAIELLSQDTGNPAIIFRLPGVFGKWCKPNYNSVVATFCYNIVHGLEIKINDSNSLLTLVYIDDVVDSFIENLMKSFMAGITRESVQPEYTSSLGDLANAIYDFKNARTSLISEKVGNGFLRALYSTYVSYFPPAMFTYPLKAHADERGTFVEMLKTKDSGQFSFFTAHPGITRGGHYHHTKTEKFLVLKGTARFGFRHVLTNKTVEIEISDNNPTIVETVPGWSHDITNIGDDEIIVMLWANEIFDSKKPDTISSRV